MRQLRYFIIALCGWFFLLYNIERLIAPINIASFVYVFVAGITVLLLFSVQLAKLALPWLFAIILPLYFALKWVLGIEVGGAHLPLTITELSAIIITTSLARMIGLQVEEWRRIITSLTIGDLHAEHQPFETGQAQIYREIRRARRHQRAAALLAISAVESSTESTTKQLRSTPLYRFLEEVQRETLDKYVSARVAELLVAELGDLAIVTKRDNHFVTLLPETDGERVQEITRKLQTAAKEKLGLQLKIGISTFPDRAVTFETMLENAESEMVNATELLNVKAVVSNRSLEKAAVEVPNGVTLEPVSTRVK